MAKLPLTSQMFTGTTVPCTVAVRDDTRRYLAFYDNTGECALDVGEIEAGTAPVIMGEGGYYETDGILTSKVQFTGDLSRLVVLQDTLSKIVVSSGGRPLTYGDVPIYFKQQIFFKHGALTPPTFN